MLDPTLSRLKRLANGFLMYGAIIVGTLTLLDLALIASGQFPPPTRPGHPELGWIPAPATGSMVDDTCWDLASERTVTIGRNEDGLRTHYSRAQLDRDTTLFKVAVSGDSHTELCAPNDSTHFGVTEHALDEAGVPAAVFAYGAGKYSVLQAYLAVRPAMWRHDADAFVLNFYSGNDFYDMLRVDDRPHLAASADGYELAPPIWYQEDPPDLKRRSRVLYALRMVGDVTGIGRAWVRIRYLNDVAAAQGEGVGQVVGYMNDLRRARVPEVEYPEAFVAQMLNQQLFFHRFPAAVEDSRQRVKYLMEMIRRENPDRLLLMSPIPSYQLVYRDDVPAIFMDMLQRLPITNESGIAEEESFYRFLEQMAAETGWLFVDNLATLRAAHEKSELYNHADYHLQPVASEVIGQDQARVILQSLGRTP